MRKSARKAWCLVINVCLWDRCVCGSSGRGWVPAPPWASVSLSLDCLMTPRSGDEASGHCRTRTLWYQCPLVVEAGNGGPRAG